MSSPRPSVHSQLRACGPGILLWSGVLVLFLVLNLRGAGIYPVVFADEWSYSSFSRLLPLRDAGVPSYLYLALFRSTNACGDGFLECARILNNALLVASVPFIYAIARRVCGPWPSAVVALLSVAGAFSTYTIYFMPEATYFAGFWVLSWLALRRANTMGLGQAVLVGSVLGALSLVKVHALFLLPGLAVHAAYKERMSDRSGRIWRSAATFGLVAAAFAAVKFGLGYLLAGRAGVTVLGSMYGSQAGGVVHGKGWAMLAAAALGNLAGHAMALAILFGVPLAALLGTRWNASDADVRSPGWAKQELVLYTLVILIPLLAVVGYFTASVAGSGPYENLGRLHMRYYNFALPLLLIIAASELTGAHTFTRTRAWIATALAGFSAYALVALMPAFTPSMVDSPELRGLTLSPDLYFTLGSLGAAATLAWAFKPRWAVRVFVFVLFPVMAIAGNWQVSAEVRQRQVPDAYDDAGLFAKRFLGPSAAGLTVVGANGAALLRTLFHVDNAKARTMQVPAGSRIDFGKLPKGTEWLLVVGDYDLPSDAPAAVVPGPFRLVRTAQDYRVDFRQGSWPGELARAQGLSTPESWGTWSVGREVQLQFAAPLPRRFTLTLRAHSFGPNSRGEFRVLVGDEEHSFRVKNDDFEDISLEFSLTRDEQVVRITIPDPVSPQSLGQGNDTRMLGLALAGVKVTALRLPHHS